MRNAYDCLVIGGGPAGATAAALVAQAGFTTLLVEREKFPRPQVGASLMPEAYWTLRRLGLLEQMARHGFVSKRSVRFISSTGRESEPFFFHEHDPRDCSQTWQVDRGEFDKMLFDHAAAQGADCFQQMSVTEVLFERGRAVGARLESVDGVQHEVRCRVVVDASGQRAILAHQLGLRSVHDELHNAAIWGYYRHARRDSGESAGATLILHTREKKSWFWFVPLAHELTSIGVVGEHNYLLKGRGNPCSIFEDELVRCPALVERLMNAELASLFHVSKDFSFSTTQRAGEGWTLVGDAGGFIDPIYSSGVYLALKSGEMAADAIREGLQAGDVSAAQLGKWTKTYDAGVQRLRKLVQAFYTREFSFGDFIREHPQHRANLIDLLFGRIFCCDAGRIFPDLDAALERARNDSAGAPLASRQC